LLLLFLFLFLQSNTDENHDENECLTIENAVIKGFHVYNIRPPFMDPPTKLVVDREYSNTHDKSACLVWVPPLEDFPSNIHSMFTDETRQLKLEDIADLPIGHVPKCSLHYTYC